MAGMPGPAPPNPSRTNNKNEKEMKTKKQRADGRDRAGRADAQGKHAPWAPGWCRGLPRPPRRPPPPWPAIRGGLQGGKTRNPRPPQPKRGNLSARSKSWFRVPAQRQQKKKEKKKEGKKGKKKKGKKEIRKGRKILLLKEEEVAREGLGRAERNFKNLNSDMAIVSGQEDNTQGHSLSAAGARARGRGGEPPPWETIE